ncbi:hypothetical protein FRC17_004730, partial [Serendipita sp. 399]
PPWPAELDPEALETDEKQQQWVEEQEMRQKEPNSPSPTLSSAKQTLLDLVKNKTTGEGGRETTPTSSSASTTSSTSSPYTETNPAVLNEVRALHYSIARKELREIVLAFKQLRFLHALGKFQDVDVTTVSQMLSEWLSRAPISQERTDAEEMAVFFSTRRVSGPLNEAMKYHLMASNRLERIFGLWDMYHNWGTKPRYLVGKRTLEKDDRLLYVCAAAAIRNEFTWIYHAMGTSISVFDDWRLREFVYRTLVSHEPAVRQRFMDFMHDAMLARDVDLYFPLVARVNEASELGDHDSIKSLCTALLDGIERKLLFPSPAIEPKVPKSTWTPSIVDEGVWSLLMYGAVRCRKEGLAEWIMGEMKRIGIRPSIGTWNYLLMGVNKMGDRQKMKRVLDEMKEAGQAPDLRSQIIVMKFMFDQRLLREAGAIFRSIKESNAHRPRTDEENKLLLTAHNVVLNGLLRNRDLKAAAEVFEKMQQTGPAPDVVTFNTLLNRYAHKGERKLISETLRLMAKLGIQPDVYTFTILFVNACYEGDEEMKSKLVSQMGALDLKANKTLFSAAIRSIFTNGEGELGKPDTALMSGLQLLSGMERSGDKDLKPNAITYTTVLQGIRYRIEIGTTTFAAGHQLIEEVYSRMIDRGFRPNRVTLHVLIQHHLQSHTEQSLQKAMGMFEELCKEGVDNQKSWYVLLKGLEKRGSLSVAAEMIERLRRSSITPKGALLGVIERLSRMM